jgi:hypothetical protein
MALDLSSFVSKENVVGVGGQILNLGKLFVLMILLGVIIALILIVLIRPLLFKYRTIIIEKRASGGIAIGVDRSKTKVKKGEPMKTIFLNRKGSFEGVPYSFLFPTVKKGLFDIFAPNNSYVCFSYKEDNFTPVNLTEDFGRFVFEQSKGTSDYWADLERKEVRQKYNRKTWLQEHAGILIVSGVLITGMTIILIMMLVASK